MSKIFISHSSVNNASALAIADWLRENGWDDFFLDISPARGLAPGERWQEALKNAADRCEAILFLISPVWRDSRWCLAEFLLAKQLGKKIFGVLVDATPLDTLPKEMTGEWQLCDLVAGAKRRTFHVSADPIVSACDVSFAQAGLERLRLGLQKAGLDPATFPWPPPNDLTRAPYPGLKALAVEDAAVFFGREAAIVRGLDALRGLRERGVERMLVVLGASGAGKSSFLRAGLWPRLERDDRHFLPVPVIRPERAVISGPSGIVASLEAALRKHGRFSTRAEIRKALQTPISFHHLLRELQSLSPSASHNDTPPTIILPIDQAEELFAAEGREEAETLLTLLGQLIGPPAAANEEKERLAARQRSIVLFAIRSDSYERLQTEPRLAGLAPFLFDLRPLTPTEYKVVIEGPAARATAAGRKLIVEPALIERLLNDAAGADALPLLAFTLERLFVEHGGDGDLRLEEYDELGGIRGSINAAIEASFAEPARDPVIPGDTAEQERLLRTAFIPWLAGIDPDTDERKRRVARWEEIPAESRPLMERLINQRLLVRDRRGLSGAVQEADVLEVAHEALLRQWSSLVTWLDEDADQLKQAEAVRRAAEEWRKNDRNEPWLVHTAARLESALALQQRPNYARLLGQEGDHYLRACETRERQARAEREAQLQRIADEQARTARAQKRATLLLALFAVVLLATGGWIVRQTRAVSFQTSLVLAASAQTASSQRAYDRALRYAVLAARDSWMSPAAPEAKAMLAQAANVSWFVAQLQGHTGMVESAAFSPDGNRIVTASKDKTARVWDATTGKELIQLQGHTDGVDSAAFSSDGNHVLTASSDKTARVWDATTGKELTQLQGHTGMMNSSAVFSPDGNRIVTASGNTARVWDPTTGQELTQLQGHTDRVISAVFSPDGNRILTASSDKTARVWDATTGKELTQLQGHTDRVISAVFSPNGRRIVTPSFDGTARIWDATTGQELTQLQGHTSFVISAAFSPNGRRIVTPSFDGTARIWDATTGQELTQLQGHTSFVISAAFSPDGNRIVTASIDKTARVWDATTGKELTHLKGHRDTVASAVYSPDGNRIVTASGNTARVWDPTTGQELTQLQGHTDRVISAVFSPDGNRILTASSDKTARVWDATTGKELTQLQGHRDTVNSAVFSPDGNRIVTASGNTARVWDATTGKELAQLQGHRDTVNSAVFSPDGRRIVTPSFDGTARIWDATTGQELTQLQGHTSWLNSAVFSPDGRRIVTASFDGTARVWDATTGQELAQLRGHALSVASAVFSPDGRRIVTASDDGTARIWEVRWLTQYYGRELIVAVCREKLIGASTLTTQDIFTASLLRGREGEDVCAPY